jgi:predicted AAA+ superfamily ATPase
MLSDTGLLGKQIRVARRRAAALTVLRGVIEDPIGQAFLALLGYLDRRAVEEARPDADGAATPRGSTVAAAYAKVFSLLADEAAPGVDAADAWQSHLLWRVLDDRNPFSLHAERGGGAAIPVSLLDQARRDLRSLQWLYSLGASVVRDAAMGLVGDELGEALAPWLVLGRPARASDPRLTPARRLSAALDWGALAEELAGHWHTYGLGLFSRFRAARWLARDGGTLQGLAHIDPIRLENLVGYDAERAPLLRNTERFLAGLPAHHAILYGERGTGKSSTVKALLHAYEERGLRLIELAKEDLDDLSRVLALLRDHPQRFILFVDDLSFEEQEIQYKALKAALEGTIEAWPPNVLLYVTSNRRHLVKERFSDREMAPAQDGEVRPRDTMEEKLSLADRFGVQVIFPSPDQERYVAIALALAHAQGVQAPDADLRKRAIQWALWHNGRSCRSARQFVNDLIGDAL